MKMPKYIDEKKNIRIDRAMRRPPPSGGRGTRGQLLQNAMEFRTPVAVLNVRSIH